MATTSPYDGAVGTSPDVPADHEPLSFTQSVRPPGAVPEGRLKRLAHRCKRRLVAVSPLTIPLIVSCLAGTAGVVIYLVTHPYPDAQPRKFKPFPPWDDEAWLIAGSFLTCAVMMFFIVGRLRREVPRL